MQKIKETYPPYKDLEGDRLSEVIFATRPSSGACGEYLFVVFFVLARADCSYDIVYKVED